MKNAFVIVTLSGLLSACAVSPGQLAAGDRPAGAVRPESSEADALDEAAAAQLVQEEARLPRVQLSSELLYTLMKAELEFRGGNWQGPFDTLMAAARQTGDPRLAQRALDMAVAAKQQAPSLSAIRLWRELDPVSEQATEYLLGLVVLGEKLDEAETIFRQRLQDASPATRGVAMIQVQQHLVRARDKAAAGALLERLLSPYAGSFEAHIVLAQSAFARGAAERAVAEAREALRLKPDSELAMLTMAQVLPDPAQVNALLVRFLDRYPNAREVRGAYARILVNDKRFGDARKQFATLDKQQPDQPGTLYALGIMSMQLDEPLAAEGYFKRHLELLAAADDGADGDERDPSRVLVILAQLAEQRGDLKGAMQWLEKIDDSETQTWFSAQIKRGQLIGKQGDLAGARAFLDGLAANDPAAQVQIVVAQSQVLRDAGKLEEAYAVMADGAKRFPANPELLYDYALMAERTGRIELMEETLREVMAQAPDNHHAYNALGYSLAERNVRLPEALILIEKALKMAPDDPFIMDSMGWVQYRLGHLDQAENYLRKAYSLRSDVEIAVHLGEVLWHKGLKTDAQKLWREARTKDPKNDTLNSTLARLQLTL